MPITVSWDNEAKTIVRTDISGAWTWEEFHASLDEAHALISAVSHPVVTINVRHLDARDPSGNPLPHYSRAARQVPANQVLTINVTSQQSMNSIVAKVLMRLFPFMKHGFHVVGTLDEARALAAQLIAESA